MTNEESVLVNPPRQDTAVHVRDYENFIRMFKWGAVACLVIGLLSLIIIKSYW